MLCWEYFLSSLEANLLCARENNILRQTEQKITKRLNYFRFMTYFYDFCFRKLSPKSTENLLFL